MLKVQIKEGESIDRALKRYKRKCKNVKLIQQLRANKCHYKPSAVKRKKMQKARHKAAYLRMNSELF